MEWIFVSKHKKTWWYCDFLKKHILLIKVGKGKTLGYGYIIRTQLTCFWYWCSTIGVSGIVEREIGVCWLDWGCCPVFMCPVSKTFFVCFKCLAEEQRKTIPCDTWHCTEFIFQWPNGKSYWNTHTPVLMKSLQLLLCYNGRAEWLQYRTFVRNEGSNHVLVLDRKAQYRSCVWQNKLE